MQPAIVSLVVAATVFGGSLFAMYAARVLPDSHFSAEARDVIKLAMALIATLVALVLGLMIATAKGTYDSQASAIRQLSANVLLLDRDLSEFGPEAQQPRDLLREVAALMLQRLWPADGAAPASLAPGESRPQMDEFLREVTSLSPQSEMQQFLKTQALRLTSELAQARLLIYVQGASELPLPFLVVMAIWLIVLFGGYGLIAARNPTVLFFLLACTLSVSGAVFLIEELADPFGGVIRVSSLPLREVLDQLDR